MLYVQNMERVHQDLMRDVTQLQQQLQSNSQQLRRKEAELTRAEETTHAKVMCKMLQDLALTILQCILQENMVSCIESCTSKRFGRFLALSCKICLQVVLQGK